MEIHMTTQNDKLIIDEMVGMSARPITFKSYKDALCFALDAREVLKAAAKANNHPRLTSEAASMERLCRDMRDYERFSHEQAMSIANDIRTIAHNIARINDGGENEEMLDDPLLYAVETLFDLAIIRLETERASVREQFEMTV